jgi:hypothetical protein
MKSIIIITSLLFSLSTLAFTGKLKTTTPINCNLPKVDKYNIKIKNDSGDEVTVYNASSGGSYRLMKNTTTNIKMENGDKLYNYEGGKKGRLLLTASADMDGKVQLYSKL